MHRFYSEIADPWGKMDYNVSKIVEETTSKQETTKFSLKIKDLVDHMKPRWERMMNAVERYEKKEEKLDKLIREADTREALVKFRHVISVFRGLVCKEMGTEWEKLHPHLKAKDKETLSSLDHVLRKTFRMSSQEWDTLSNIARMGSEVAHSTFVNDEEIAELLKQLPDKVSDEDRGLLQKLTSRLIDEWEVRDKIIERRRKSSNQ